MPRFDATIAGELNLDLILYVAHNLAALGARVGFVSCIGDDPLGQIALERLAAGSVDVSEVRKRTGKQTGLTVLLQRDGWRNIVTYAGTIFDLRFEDLDFDYLSDSRHFHLSSYFLHRGLRDRIVELLGKTKAAGLTISLDTNDDPDDLWQGGLTEALRYVDIFLPNAREAKKIAGTEDAEAALGCLAKRVPLVVMKIGAEGAVAQRGEARFSSPAVKVNAVDSVGAGDSFDAGFLWQYLRGAEVPTCLTAGNLAGAFSTTRPGGTEAFRDREYREKFFAANTTDLKPR
jgi:sugar/nucleoside kinase (ribokinase family)